MSNKSKLNPYTGDLQLVYDDTPVTQNIVDISENTDNITENLEDIVKNSDNIMLSAFRIAVNGALSIFNIIDGFIDEYEDETGIDGLTSSHQNYSSINKYYSPQNDIDADTKLLLHLNGNDGQISTIDSSDYVHPVSFIGTAQLDTSKKKFESASLLLNGSTDYATVANDSDWDFGTGDFTIDWWEYRVAGSGASLARTHNQGFCSFVIGYDASNGILMSSNNSSWDIAFFKTLGTQTLNQWVHYAVVRSGTTFKTYKNGVQSDTWTSALSMATSSNPLSIGCFDLNGDVRLLNGWMDEIRVSKGIARWTSNFTPPTSEYGSDITNNMTLISEPTVAQVAPDDSRMVMLEEDVDVITLNTDIKAYASNDDGANWHQGSLSDEGNYDTSKRILVADFDVSAQEDTDMVYKITTANLKNLKIHATALTWG